jgi:hypothetical protein
MNDAQRIWKLEQDMKEHKKNIKELESKHEDKT